MVDGMRTKKTGSSGSCSGHPTTVLWGEWLKKLCPTQFLIYKAEEQHLNINLELVQEARGSGEGAEGEGRK